jgi:regulation of enolase protein 1 (concanavalin A-like superfamily)
VIKARRNREFEEEASAVTEQSASNNLPRPLRYQSSSRPVATPSQSERNMPVIPQVGVNWKSPLKFWRNKPVKKVTEEGMTISFQVAEKTDYWRKTRGGFILDNAPFYWHKLTGDFEVFAKINAELTTNYDKAGLMVRLDEENWVFSALEFYEDRVHHSTSVTKDFTDWTLSLLPEGSEKEGVWISIRRYKSLISCSYSLNNGREWTTTRECVFTERPVLNVGVAAACPMGKEFKVTFERYGESQV